MKLPAIRISPCGMLVLVGFLLFFTFLNLSVWYRKQNKETMVSLRQLLAVSISVAEMGGKKVHEVRESANLKIQSKGETKEGANIPLTAGDLLSHRTMVSGLHKMFPNIQIISEEHDDKNPYNGNEEFPIPKWSAIAKVVDDIEIPSSNILVWIDPLDATQEYTENLLEYVTTMVCVAVKGVPVIGVIHLPFKNETVWAWVDHGVSDIKQKEPQSMRSAENVPNIIVSRSHAGKVSDVAKAAFGPKTVITAAGGAGYKALQVATGNADAYIHVTQIKKWDICAGNVLLNSLGGQMTTLSGSLIGYGNAADEANNNGVVATLHHHQQYLEKLSSLNN